MQLAATPCSTPEPSIENLHQSSSPNYLVKDGRVIEIGDCALFRSGDSPPFIGIILSFLPNYQNTPEKTKSSTSLSVNWLYRPSDIRLSRGNILEAAPNEVFYSFHKDIVAADSLLHPCKVSFLRKGTDLKNGVSSFVCRRVYDIENKRLWWLTDKNYINERQAEVNKLLDKTQSEMNASSQQGSSGNRQPKSLHSPIMGQMGHDDTNGLPSFLHSNSNKTGRKRDRGGSDTVPLQPIKRDPDPFASAIEEDNNTYTDTDSVQSEISKITEMGGLASIEAVEKLLNLMQSDRTERKLDLTGRVMLAGIIAGTDTSDNKPLLKFVQMSGVTILDEWLQEARTKEGEHNKNNNKAIEELLLALLHALERLPINLKALRMCNIGKSVNHLRGHKNVEVQKKARFLVDTWKRRVDAEMKANELKTGVVQLAASKSVQGSKTSGDQSPNSSSSFGSVKPGPVNIPSASSTGRHQKRSINGQAQRTTTGPNTRSSDVRLNWVREDLVAIGSSASSPVHVNQFQAGKLKKHEVNEETFGFEEDNSDKCAGTGTGLVPVPVRAGDDLGLLASVAAGEMSKSVPKEDEPGCGAASNNNENNDKNNMDNENEKNDKNSENDKNEKNNLTTKEEMKASELKTGLVQLAALTPVQGRTTTGPNTRSSDNSIGHRIAVRLKSIHGDLVANGSSASSPVHAHQVQAGKLKKHDANEEMVGFEEDNSEKCTGTGTGSVLVHAGDDLGLLASVAAAEMSKSEPKEDEPCCGAASNNNENNDKNNMDNENEKNDKNSENDKSEKNNTTAKEELASTEKILESDMEPKLEGHLVKFEDANIKYEKKGITEKELVLVPVQKLAERENTEDLAGPGLDNPAGTSVDKKETSALEPITTDLAEGGASTSAPLGSSSKVEFDLNEGIVPVEEGPNADSDLGPTSATNFSFLNPPFTPKVTVGPFLSQENLLRPIRGSELGRVGSGPTSAFRPAEPRRGLEMSIGITRSDLKPLSNDVTKLTRRPVLEFDLNVPDKRLLEESMGPNPDGFELDLNRTDGDPGTSAFRGFDLNGPSLGMDESCTCTENLMNRNQFPSGGLSGMTAGDNSNIPFLPQSMGLRMINNDAGHIWFPQSGSFPGPGPNQVSGPFGGTSVYRLPGNNAIVYPAQSQNHFPFGFHPSTGTPYQPMVGAGLGLSQRPYFVGLPEGSSNSDGSNVGQGMWVPVGRPGSSTGLDLNAGPGAGSSVEYMVHVDQVLGGGKRKEPEGGWDRDRDRDRSTFGGNKQFLQ